MTQFALLTYTTNNLGDDIQSIAAQQFLPSTDLLVDRDNWATQPAALGEYKVILNGWHTREPGLWPPPPFLIPCLISVHITAERFRMAEWVPPADVLLAGTSLDYLRRRQPIGARDTWTAAQLAERGVESYFSGCLTLTLGADEERERRDYICAVDLPDEVCAALAEQVRSPIVRLTQFCAPEGRYDERYQRSCMLLDHYAHAKCVVTTRLHCALPCLAFGTPVFLVDTQPDQYRFSGLSDLVRHGDARSFVAGQVEFKPDEPARNGDAYRSLRRELIRSAEAFVGAPMKPYAPRLSEAIAAFPKLAVTAWT